MNSDRSAQLGHDNIPWLLLKFATPATVGLLAQGMYAIIDRAFIGRALGANAVTGIAGISVAFPFMLVVLAFGMLVGFGGTALVSIRLGERKKAEAEQILGNITTLLVILSLLITVVSLSTLDPILRLFGASDIVLPYARDYLKIIILGTIFQTVGFGLNAVIRGEGNPFVAMFSMLISVVLNVAFAPIFIFWLGWGMKGAALATVLAQIATAVWVLAHFHGRTSVLKLRVRNLSLRWSICVAIFAIGSPACALQLAASVFQCLLNRQLGIYGKIELGESGGDLAISVMGIVFAVITVFVMPVFGINQGTQPIVGYNHGARRFDRVKKALETAILAASGVTTFGFVMTMLFPGQFVRIFAAKPETLRTLLPLGAHAVRVCTLMFPIVGFQIVSAGYFQAVGKPVQALFLMLSRQVILLIPAVLILPVFFGLNGVWAALPTADFIAAAWTGVCLLLELRHLRDQHQTTESPLCSEPFVNL